jgi:HPt (histidine-containing phosphotransfer) domain-containing protein
MTTSFPEGRGFTFLNIETALAQIGDVDSLREMLGMLQDSLNRDVLQIKALLDQGDVAAASRLLHALKGFIPIFCIDALCDQVAQIEQMSKTDSAVSVAQVYAVLMPQLQQLQVEINQYLE